MRRLFQSLSATQETLPHGSAPIAAGLAILAATMLRPGVPMVTAMALVACGATSATLARFRGTAAFLPIMLVHLAMYGSLYALFVGATLHAAATHPGAALGAPAIVDLALSVGPLAIALERTWCELRASDSAA